MSERRIWLARLPEMRLAYFESLLEARPAEDSGVVAEFEGMGRLFDAFNEWRVRVRPALGRIDIAAIGWAMPPDADGRIPYRACVPIRSDYQPPEPAKTTFFPGGSFLYAFADHIDEIEDVSAAVREAMAPEGLTAHSGLIEVYKFHYNMDQHPSDCGFLVKNADGTEPVPLPSSHASPLPIAR
ncbi:MAG: GyrI-like domain-containing protein [bacterium]